MTYKELKPFWEILGFIWALPNTLLGVILLILSGGYVKKDHYSFLRFRFWPRKMWWFPTKKFWATQYGTIGMFVTNKVDATDETLKYYVPKDVFVHEDEHCIQNMKLGPLFIVLIPLLTLLALVLYGKPYHAQWLEMMARDVAGEEVDCIEDRK